MSVKIQSDRNVFLDTLKGILIIFVVIGHSPSVGSSSKIIFSIIYCFHMPAFFVLSSLNLKSRFRDELKGVKLILIIYLFWLIFSTLKNNSNFFNVLLFSNWQHLKNILWFLPALIIFKLYFSLLSVRNLKILFFTLGIFSILYSDILLYYLEFIPWGINIAVYMTPCILVLKELYNRIDFISNYPSDKSIIIISTLFIASLISFIYVESSLGHAFPYYYLDFAQFVVPTIYGYIFLFLMMFSIIALTKVNIKDSWLSFLGKNTMPIYLFHYFFILLIPNILPINNYIAWVLLIILSIIFPLMISSLLKKITIYFKYLGA